MKIGEAADEASEAIDRAVEKEKEMAGKKGR